MKKELKTIIGMLEMEMGIKLEQKIRMNITMNT